jgi:hypothetical protein
MNTARTSLGEFRTSHAGTGTATFWLVPDTGPDVIFPGLTAADLRAISAMTGREADQMEPARETEPVQVRLSGTPHAVTILAGILTARLGPLVGRMAVKNRHEYLAQGYLTVLVPKGQDQ